MLSILRNVRDRLDQIGAEPDPIYTEAKRLWSLSQVGDIRQAGCVLAVELVRDWRTREPFKLAEQAGIRVCDGLAKRGVLTRSVGNVIVIMPPFCTTQQQVKKIFSALHDSIEETLNKP